MTFAAYWLVLALGTGTAVAQSHAATPARKPAPERAVEQVTARLLEWFADPSPQAARALRDRVRMGAPPKALIALLERYRQSPRPELLDVVKTLAAYRRVDVRARALVAWAEAGPLQADDAIAAAARDMAPSVRRLAVALADRHPSTSVTKTIAELLARDEALAAEVAERDAARQVEGSK